MAWRRKSTMGSWVRDLAFDPDVAVLLLDHFAHLRHEVADGPDSAPLARRVEAQAKLVVRVAQVREWIVRGH
jgi:hypothetical protein